MAKKKPKRKTNAQLSAEITKLKKLKEDAKNRKELYEARKKEVEELRKLRGEVASLKYAGSNKQLAGKVAKRLGSQAGKASWKGLKVAGKFVKERLEAEAREQDRQRARSKPKSKPRKKK